MADEKNLEFFKTYTKSSCEQECLADQTLMKCGCVQFFMIRKFWIELHSSFKIHHENSRKLIDEDLRSGREKLLSKCGK